MGRRAADERSLSLDADISSPFHIAAAAAAVRARRPRTPPARTSSPRRGSRPTFPVTTPCPRASRYVSRRFTEPAARLLSARAGSRVPPLSRVRTETRRRSRPTPLRGADKAPIGRPGFFATFLRVGALASWHPIACFRRLERANSPPKMFFFRETRCANASVLVFAALRGVSTGDWLTRSAPLSLSPPRSLHRQKNRVTPRTSS